MAQLPQDRLVRKEVALGLVRERPKPEGHIGLNIAPFQAVESDDVIFQHVQLSASGLAPARAEDSEAEMAGKEETIGEGRASLIDWSIKDHYTTSDVTRYRESLLIGNALPESLPLTSSSITEGFQNRVARDTALRRRKLDNRLEWLIMEALWKGRIAYNDGKIIFDVSYDRPSPQQNASVTATWDDTDADPIGDLLEIQEYMYDTHGTTITRGMMSKKIARKILTSDRFAARSGLAGGTGSLPVDPNYLIDGWGYEAALGVVERATGISFQLYDSGYRTRAAGSTSTTFTRYSPEDKILLLPAQSDIDEIDDFIGFGKTFTSPHPAGNWTPGFYEWEKDLGQDPWGYDVGTGIKAFPVFPHLDLTYVLKVLA